MAASADPPGHLRGFLMATSTEKPMAAHSEDLVAIDSQ